MDSEMISQMADLIIVCTFSGIILAMFVDAIGELSILFHKKIRQIWKKHQGQKLQ